MAAAGFAFGPFQLDAHAKQLRRDGVEVPLAIRQFDLLHVLVSRAGETLSKDDLIQAVWQGLAVSDTSVEQAVFHVRRALDAKDKNLYIKTVPRRGYRFIAPVRPWARVGGGRSRVDFEALLAPLRAWIDGRAALETLELAQIILARATFEALVAEYPHEAACHVGLANACVLQYEATRADAEPDRAALRLAAVHAREACRLDPDHAEACATLGFVLERTGDRAGALAALRRAVMLEPENWRHWIRLAYGSWGEERLRAARQTLALLPGCPLAHCLIATVYVARCRFADAERELDAGIAAMPAEGTAPARFSAVALYWLKGLLCLVRGALDEALAAFARELALESRGHLYARECCANTWCAIGVVHLRRGDQAAARAAFEQAITRVPRHLMARVGLALLSSDRSPDGLAAAPMSVDVAVARAVLLVAAADAPAAAQLVAATLASAPPDTSTGWLVPIEPLLSVQQERAAWTAVLATLVVRAS